jgi:hypothetical protein
MPERDALTPEILEAIRQEGGAQIVVGLPTYNNSATVGAVVTSLREGLRAAFPSQKSIIVNTDCGSTDETAQTLAAATAGEGDPQRLIQVVLPAQSRDIPYHGIPGRDEGLHLTLRVARAAGARVCLILSPDLTSLSPDWIGALCRPVLEHEFDFVAPIYARNRFDGAITNAIVRPLIRSLYGKHMRQPMGGEYAFSAVLMEKYLGDNIWGTDLARVGIDLWTTTLAIRTGRNLCQVHLGPKNQATSMAQPDLGTVLVQVLGCLFEDMTRNASVWQKIRGAQPIRIFGAPSNEVPSAASLDAGKLADAFRLGYRNLQDLWRLLLPPATALEIKRLAALAPESHVVPDDVWARVVFDFALAYRMRTLNRNHLLGSFLPLYLGWLASFVSEMQTATFAETERRLEQVCRAFEAQKPHLIARWRSPDGFNP